MKKLAVFVFCMLPTSVFAQDCSTWLTYAFWSSADANAVQRCVSPQIVNARAEYEETPLHFAASQADDVEILKILVDAGANIAGSDVNGAQPLRYAATNSNPAIVEFLLAAGADVTARDNSGATALHYAALTNSNSAVVIALINAGADIFAEDADGKTPIDYAKRNQSEDGLAIYLMLKQGMLN